MVEMAGRENERSEETMWIMSAIPSRSNNLGLNINVKPLLDPRVLII